jgi:hypothetical protein
MQLSSVELGKVVRDLVVDVTSSEVSHIVRGFERHMQSRGKSTEYMLSDGPRCE